MLGGLHRALGQSGLSSCVASRGDDDWPSSRSGTLVDFIQELETVRTTTLAEAGIATPPVPRGQNHNTCTPWDTIDWEEVLCRFMPSAEKLVLEFERCDMAVARGQSGIRLPSSWPADQASASVFYAALMLPPHPD